MIRRDGAMAQILYSSASRPAESRQRLRVRAEIENLVEPVTAALERCAEMRRAQENELAESA